MLSQTQIAKIVFSELCVAAKDIHVGSVETVKEVHSYSPKIASVTVGSLERLLNPVS